MRFRDKLDRIKNPNDLWLLLEIIGLAFLLPLLLRYLRFPDLLLMLGKKPARLPDPDYQNRQAEKVRLFTNFVLGHRFAGRKTCLKRSLILYHFLRKIGLNVEIELGIARQESGLIGHSWLTCNGSPYPEPEPGLNYYQIILSSHFPSLRAESDSAKQSIASDCRAPFGRSQRTKNQEPRTKNQFSEPRTKFSKVV